MIEKYMEEFNRNYTEQKYLDFISSCEKDANLRIPFRLSETPVFASRELYNQALYAGEEIISQVESIIKNVDLDDKISKNKMVEGDEGEMTFLCLDYAVTKNNNNLELKLIELQGFPSLFAFQNYLGVKYKGYWELDNELNYLLDGLDFTSYNDLLKDFICGGYNPENVVLLEIDPWNQGTAVDFYYSEKYFGIKTICLSQIKNINNNLFYKDNGKLIPIKRIYNRIILDELERRTEFINEFNFYNEANVEWVCHPNWFQKCSKLMMPYLKSHYVPETHFYNDVNVNEFNLEDWVLKPIFSFSGQGVIFDITNEDLVNLTNTDNYILQKKIKYEPLVRDINDEYSKVELRIMYIKKDGKYLPVTNLGRMTKGNLVGVKFNKDKIWVGSNIFLFEK